MRNHIVSSLGKEVGRRSGISGITTKATTNACRYNLCDNERGRLISLSQRPCKVEAGELIRILTAG